MLKSIRGRLFGLALLLLGGWGLWTSGIVDFDASLDRLPDYDYLPEIRELNASGRLGEAEHLVDYALEGTNLAERAQLQALRADIHRERTAFMNRCRRVISGFILGKGTSVEEIGGAITADFFLYGDLRDLAVQGYNKVTGRDADPVIAALAAAGAATSIASYIPDPAEGAEVSADASLSLLKTFRKTGHLSKRFCGVIVEGCKQSVKAKSLTKGMKEIVVGIKDLFAGAGAARAAAVMKHVDDATALKAAGKMAKKTPEPLAILVRKHGAEGVEALKALDRAEDGAEALAKAARKGPKGMEMLLQATKCGARTTKMLRHGRPKALALAMGRGPLAALSALFVALGAWRLRLWRAIRVLATRLRAKRKAATT